MTQHDDFIARLESYLDDFEGSTPMPDGIRQSVRASLPSTRQMTGPAWGPWRFLGMTLQVPAPVQFGLAAAVLAAAVVIGATIFGSDGGVGNPDDASSTPAPTRTAAPSADPSPSGPVSIDGVPSTGNLPAGHYFLDVPAYPARIEFQVPDGWWHFWAEQSRDASDVHAILVDSTDTGAASGSAWGVAFAVVDRVYVDPCEPTAATMDPSVTESAGALATAFQAWPDFPAASVEEVTVGGYTGTRVEIKTDASPCLGRLFTTPAGYAFEIQRNRPEHPQPPEQFTFLDVDGSVLVLWTTDYPGTNYFEMDGGAEFDPEAHAEHQSELRAILDSIEIVPRSESAP